MDNKISIITVTLNSEQHLEQTITSVIGQTYKNFEYIIIDGGSTDGTLDIIAKYKKNIDRWLSEPDRGIADAMNKGLSMTTGDFVLFLHSDDYLPTPETLGNAVGLLDKHADINAFDIYQLTDEKLLRRSPRGMNWWMNLKTGLLHQGTICSKALFEQIGNFDPEFSIAMDYDFFLRAYRQDARTSIHPMVLSVMRTSGISSATDISSLAKRLQEERKVHTRHSTKLSHRILYSLYWIIYPLYKMILQRIRNKFLQPVRQS